MIDWLQCNEEGHVGLLRCRERACKAVDTIEQIRVADDTTGLRWAGLTRLGVCAELHAGRSRCGGCEACWMLSTVAGYLRRRRWPWQASSGIF